MMLDAPLDIASELLALCLPASSVGGLHDEAGLSAAAAASPREDPAPAPSAPAHDEAHWECLISQAIQQGVAPLVAVRSRALSLPVPVRERLESLYRSNALRNLRLAAEESRLCSALSAAGIPHWTLKGPGLSERLYADIGVRQIADLDLLIEPANLSRVDALLAQLGFRRQTTGRIDSLAAAQELIYVRDGNCIPSWGKSALTSPLAVDPSSRLRESADGTRSSPSGPRPGAAPATFLDLHQRLLPYVRRDPLAARVFREGMTAENLLLYLCANQITHRFARLRYLCDVSAFLDRESPALDWDRFLASARALPWGPGIGLGLRWASQFSRHPAPAEVLRNLRPNHIGDLLLRRTLGSSAVEAAARSRLLDSSAGAAVPIAAAYLGRPSACGIAWNLLVPSRAYLREQTGAPAAQPPGALAAAYASRLIRKIPSALRSLWRPDL